MPGMSGFDVMSRLMADRITVPTIIITASDDVGLEQKSLRMGARTLTEQALPCRSANRRDRDGDRVRD